MLAPAVPHQAELHRDGPRTVHTTSDPVGVPFGSSTSAQQPNLRRQFETNVVART